MCDVLVEQLQSSMGDVNHDIRVIPQTRVNLLAEKDKNLCFPCMIKRQKHDFFVYSDVTTMHPPFGLIMTVSTQIKLGLDPEHPVSFADITARTDLRFGRPVARKYPDDLQHIIDSHANDSHFIAVNGTDATTRVLQQIEMNRLDYTIEYPTVMHYYQATKRAPDLVFIPIVETINDPVPGAIGCTKNAWGEQAIERINEALTVISTRPDFQNQQQLWHKPTIAHP